MKFVGDIDISTIDNAIRLVLLETKRQDMSIESVKLFLNSIEEYEFNVEGEKIFKTEIHRQYGRSIRWQTTDEHWLLSLPKLRFDITPVPWLSFDLQVHMVSCLEIMDGKHSSFNVIFGTIGKPYALTLPMIFLQAILNDSAGNFPVISKDSIRTSWNIPGLNSPLTLPDEFVKRLSYTLENKSVVTWLLEFGTQGRILAPQVAGCLLGLQFGEITNTVPLSGQAWDKEIVIAGLTRLYGEQKAKALFNQELPSLNPGMTNEDVLRVILQSIGRGG